MRHLLSLKTFAILSLLCAISTTGLAHPSQTATGRYISVDNTATTAQKDLLSQTIQVRFPQEVQTIGEALNYILRYSGYRLVDASKQSAELKNSLTKPLPLVDRNFGPMSLKEALTTLAGPAFSLVHDPLDREVNFKVKPNFLKKAK